MGDISETIKKINESIKIANDGYVSKFNSIADQVNRAIKIARPYAVNPPKSSSELAKTNDEFAKVIIEIHRIMNS